MTVLTIRAHRRYALRMPAKLQIEGRKSTQCLLVELSQDGVRVSNLGERKLEPGEPVQLNMECGRIMPGRIRWAHDGVAGVLLDTPLHLPEMSAIIHANREKFAAA